MKELEFCEEKQQVIY